MLPAALTREWHFGMPEGNSRHKETQRVVGLTAWKWEGDAIQLYAASHLFRIPQYPTCLRLLEDTRFYRQEIFSYENLHWTAALTLQVPLCRHEDRRKRHMSISKPPRGYQNQRKHMRGKLQSQQDFIEKFLSKRGGKTFKLALFYFSYFQKKENKQQKCVCRQVGDTLKLHCFLNAKKNTGATRKYI